ncbi:MAG: hypothetical protein KGI67_08895 [Pseudomonadota bacterium]|nr:hypothetical protein [Pseudomonadota bacterium]
MASEDPFPAFPAQPDLPHGDRALLIGDTPVFPTPRRVSLEPIADATLRRGCRVIAMVHELHKVGYQRLRISPFAQGISDWGCAVTDARNVHADGHSLIKRDAVLAPVCCSSKGHCYFDWHDAAGFGARQLAELFLERYPLVAERGHGQDWTYAGWLSAVLGVAEHGRLPVMYPSADARLFLPPDPPPA